MRLITFDLDDTLWDSRPILVAAELRLHDWLSHHYPRLTRHYSVEDLRRQRQELAAGRPDLRYHMTALRKESLRLAAASVGYGEELVEPAFACFLEARHAIDPYPDVAPALERLRVAGLLIGALTNGNADVRRLTIGPLFHFSLSAEDVGVAKPHPRIFLEACRRAGVERSAMLHVGDEPDTDLAGAQAAGVNVVWMNRGQHSTVPGRPYQEEVGGMYELLKLLSLE
ncbi:MAG: HAD-IA family hydrolase [Gammaproteobacteria bacterium]|nr:HAD-IA family hydrolase [Gammaproteobacteria bacterium]